MAETFLSKPGATLPQAESWAVFFTGTVLALFIYLHLYQNKNPEDFSASGARLH